MTARHSKAQEGSHKTLQSGNTNQPWLHYLARPCPSVRPPMSIHPSVCQAEGLSIHQPHLHHVAQLRGLAVGARDFRFRHGVHLVVVVVRQVSVAAHDKGPPPLRRDRLQRPSMALQLQPVVGIRILTKTDRICSLMLTAAERPARPLAAVHALRQPLPCSTGRDIDRWIKQRRTDGWKGKQTEAPGGGSSPWHRQCMRTGGRCRAGPLSCWGAPGNPKTDIQMQVTDRQTDRCKRSMHKKNSEPWLSRSSGTRAARRPAMNGWLRWRDEQEARALPTPQAPWSPKLWLQPSQNPQNPAHHHMPQDFDGARQPLFDLDKQSWILSCGFRRVTLS
jgi:hypothetical protein